MKRSEAGRVAAPFLVAVVVAVLGWWATARARTVKPAVSVASDFVPLDDASPHGESQHGDKGHHHHPHDADHLGFEHGPKGRSDHHHHHHEHPHPPDPHHHHPH